MRTIRVTGKGQIKVHPDMTRITVTLVGRHFDYGETLKRSTEDTEQLMRKNARAGQSISAGLSDMSLLMC